MGEEMNTPAPLSHTVYVQICGLRFSICVSSALERQNPNLLLSSFTTLRLTGTSVFRESCITK